MGLGRLHVITETRPGYDTLGLARATLEGGAPVLQVRAKNAADRQAFELAKAVRALCLDLGGNCIIDDRADIALAVGADGVHLGEEDLPVAVVRRILGTGLLVGATARDPETARRLETEGADYLGVGPAFATSTKQGLPDAIGPEGVAKVAQAVSIPVIAIGGVTARRIPELLAAGAHGVAVLSAVSEASHPRAATEELLAALEEAP